MRMTTHNTLGALCALIMSASVVAAPVCDGSVGREYTLRTNSAGATCHSFVTRFGPSMWKTTEECREVNVFAAMAQREYEALRDQGCTQMVNGPTRGELWYTRWLTREFTRLQSARWDDNKGWIYAE